ncbi:uncharacterized protein BDZ99DRAFT_499387 [Mytilinidion resinicola]|uniref:Extracellular membrane protein CFEM domain-containing protein n=1 Tax=Mytilinidion resinicola TaxID=574789 RepID=A0A6A6YKI5_9PEZI|nr:uncharacterized protein BDZ99DRAFT_499387 [Mytilinidion resinicola]KAF2809063.1 hypothetical protein BDZ99DRAFT_499387 [Mytilinidion resinicola]
MLFSYFKRICIIGPSLILALPQPSTTSLPKALPSSLQSTVPECARQCLDSALYTSFPVSCTSPVDLGCLCSRYSTNGSSLGEVALGCLYASCSSVPDDQASKAFNICVGQNDAVLPTQSALTITALKTTLSTVTTIATLSSTSTTHATPSPSTLQTSAKSSIRSTASSAAATSIVAAATSIIAAASVTLQASAASSSETSTSSNQGHGPLQTAQIIGIAVAGAAVISIAVGAMVLSICLRRRHERRVLQKLDKARLLAEKGSHGPSPPSQFPQFPLGRNTPPPARLRDPRGAGGVGVGVGLGVGVGVGLAAAQPAPPVQRVGLPYPYASSSNTPERPRMVRGEVPKLQTSMIGLSRDVGENTNGATVDVPLEEIGLAISPENDRHVSPESFVSTRTMSRLLPDKPVPVLTVPRKEQRHRSSMLRPDSALTTVTLFEEDTPVDRTERPKLEPILPIPPLKVRGSTIPQEIRSGGARAYAQSYVQEIETPQTPTRPQYFKQAPFGQPEVPRYAQNYGQDGGPAQAPPLSLNIPVRHSRFQPAQTVSPIQEVVSPHRPRPSHEPMERPASNSSLDGYIPDYYISPDKLLPRSEKLIASPEFQRKPSKSPKLVQIKSKASSMTVSRSTSVTSRSKRESMSSNTTFESADLDDPTPEDESDDMDKQLSPVAESPISNLRYPKVPRASNQAVPRSPKSPLSPQRQNRNQAMQARTQSPTPSLLVKRRGEKHAQELEHRLWTPEPFGQSPRRKMNSRQGHVRSGSDDSMARTAQWAESRHKRQSKSVTDFETQYAYRFRSAEPEMEALKSPLWVPKLTPTRQGDELFISVV